MEELYDYQQVKQEILHEKTSEERDVIAQAYAEARLHSHLAAMIREARHEAGLTQSQLAQRVGTDQSAISASKIEK